MVKKARHTEHVSTTRPLPQEVYNLFYVIYCNLLSCNKRHIEEHRFVDGLLGHEASRPYQVRPGADGLLTQVRLKLPSEISHSS